MKISKKAKGKIKNRGTIPYRLNKKLTIKGPKCDPLKIDNMLLIWLSFYLVYKPKIINQTSNTYIRPNRSINNPGSQFKK